MMLTLERLPAASFSTRSCRTSVVYLTMRFTFRRCLWVAFWNYDRRRKLAVCGPCNPPFPGLRSYAWRTLWPVVPDRSAVLGLCRCLLPHGKAKWLANPCYDLFQYGVSNEAVCRPFNQVQLCWLAFVLIGSRSPYDGSRVLHATVVNSCRNAWSAECWMLIEVLQLCSLWKLWISRTLSSSSFLLWASTTWGPKYSTIDLPKTLLLMFMVSVIAIGQGVLDARFCFQRLPGCRLCSRKRNRGLWRCCPRTSEKIVPILKDRTALHWIRRVSEAIITHVFQLWCFWADG